MARTTLERRFTTGEIEVRERNGKATIEGHAAVWDKLSQNLGGFVEQVQRGAFTRSIKENDVRALVNHDANFVLGRSTAGTLDLAQDDTGLYYRISPPDTSYARDLMVSMDRGDINQSSFAFMAIEDDWGMSEQDFPLRTLIQAHLVDVSPVTYPAYLDAESSISQNSAAMVSLQKRYGNAVSLNDLEAVRAAIKGEPSKSDDDEVARNARLAKRAERLKQVRLLEVETLEAV